MFSLPSDTKISRAWFDQTDIVRIASTGRMWRRTASVVIVLSTIILAAQLVSGNIERTTNLNKTSSRVCLVFSRFDKS